VSSVQQQQEIATARERAVALRTAFDAVGCRVDEAARRMPNAAGDGFGGAQQQAERRTQLKDAKVRVVHHGDELLSGIPDDRLGRRQLVADAANAIPREELQRRRDDTIAHCLAQFQRTLLLVDESSVR